MIVIAPVDVAVHVNLNDTVIVIWPVDAFLACRRVGVSACRRDATAAAARR